MTASTPPRELTTKTDHAVAESLQKVLAGTYGLYLVTHNYHWNVEGEKFVPLHSLFEGQYNELYLAVDLIAERIRALGYYALPFEGENVTQISKMTANPLNKETESYLRADRMVHNLVALSGNVIDLCQVAKGEAQEAEDDETENLLIERITAHEKALWRLTSTLK